MSRQAKGPRLHLRRRPGRAPVYVILDTGGTEISTGCGPEDAPGAEAKLAAFIGTKHQTTLGSHDPRVVLVADVLSFYSTDKKPAAGADARAVKGFFDMSYSVDRLLEWWGGSTLADVKRSTCKDYVRERTSQTNRRAGSSAKQISVGTARRELETLRAAINAYHAEHMLDAVPVVTLPEKAATSGRIRWLTHTEAAEALFACMGWRKNKDGRLEKVAEKGAGGKHSGGIRKQIRTRRMHLRRFLITGLYTGTRHMAIVRARWIPSTVEPWVDVERGLFYRRGDDERQTVKRQPPVRLPPRLVAHMRRWREIDMNREDKDGHPAPVTYVIHQNGKPLADKIRTAWEGMRADAGLDPEVVPHILRHTSATWAMQGGMSLSDAADYLGMTEEVLRAHYYHFHPDFQSEAGDAFDRSKARSKEIRANENKSGRAQDWPKKPLPFPGTNRDKR